MITNKTLRNELKPTTQKHINAITCTLSRALRLEDYDSLLSMDNELSDLLNDYVNIFGADDFWVNNSALWEAYQHILVLADRFGLLENVSFNDDDDDTPIVLELCNDED